jgi:hypothetical protein
VATKSKEWVCHYSLAGIVGLNPAGCTDMSLVGVVNCHVEVSASD